jgi:hypothetical protein
MLGCIPSVTDTYIERSKGMSQVHQGWAAHLSDHMVQLELQTLLKAREDEQRKLTRKARRTPRHVLQQRRPSAVTIVHVTN